MKEERCSWKGKGEKEVDGVGKRLRTWEEGHLCLAIYTTVVCKDENSWKWKAQVWRGQTFPAHWFLTGKVERLAGDGSRLHSIALFWILCSRA